MIAKSGGSVVLSGCGFLVNARRLAVKREAVMPNWRRFTINRSAFMVIWLRRTVSLM